MGTTYNPDSVWVKWDPFREYVTCVHRHKDDTCEHCQKVYDENREAYHLDERLFSITDNSKIKENYLEYMEEWFRTYPPFSNSSHNQLRPLSYEMFCIDYYTNNKL